MLSTVRMLYDSTVPGTVPYGTRVDSIILYVTLPVEITPKTLQKQKLLRKLKIASLNSSIARGALRSRRCLRTRNFRRRFVDYFGIPGSGVFISEFTVRAHNDRKILPYVAIIPYFYLFAHTYCTYVLYSSYDTSIK